VTEIPEHLLKRSKERRQALSGESSPAADVTAATPATTASAVPARTAVPTPAVAPPPPPPDPDYVVAAKTRKKIPFWAMATLSLLPLWALLYVVALTPGEETIEGPLAVGEAVYGSCAGCHGAAGQGGAGRVLHQGEVMKTFPLIEDMLNFVYVGSQKFVAAELAVYGDPDREGGAHAPLSYNANPMPQQGVKAGGALTEYQILGVVCYTRYQLSGADRGSDTWADEFAAWCAPDSPLFAALQSGETSFDALHTDFAELMPVAPRLIGTEARPSVR